MESDKKIPKGKIFKPPVSDKMPDGPVMKEINEDIVSITESQNQASLKKQGVSHKLFIWASVITVLFSLLWLISGVHYTHLRIWISLINVVSVTSLYFCFKQVAARNKTARKKREFFITFVSWAAVLLVISFCLK
jgi:hypothetical protein